MKQLKTKYGEILLKRYFDFLTSDDALFLSSCADVSHSVKQQPSKPAKRKRSTAANTQEDRQIKV